MEIQVKIEGLESIIDACKKAPQKTGTEISKAIQKTVLQIHNQALKEAPVNKQTGGGNLRQNISSKMISKLRGEIESRAPYSLFVHEGTRPHDIRPVYKRVLANKRTGQIFGKLVHHPGTRANPFLLRAVEKSARKMEEFFEQAIANVLKTFSK